MPGTSVRSPRISAQIGGVAVNAIMQAEITKNGSCKTSHFELTVSIIGTATDSNWLDALSGKVAATIFARRHPCDDDIAIFEGMVDSVTVDPIAGTARVVGRDYSSVLISSTYQDSFCNQTASEIANYIAARHGFTPNIMATSTMVGSYQCDGYNQVLLNVHSRITNEWELLRQLARAEGFQMYVDGTSLVFAPLASLSRAIMAIYAGDVIAMKFHQACSVSEQTTITVKSWNSWLAQGLSNAESQSWPAVPDLPDLSAAPAAQMAIVKPNLSPQDVERLVTQQLNLLNELALSVQIDMPGEMSLQPGDLLTITSGNATFDGDYIVSSVRRRFSARAGFVQSIHGFTAAAEDPILSPQS